MGIIFSSYDIRGKAGNALTAEEAWDVGKAFAEWLPNEGDVVLVRTQIADQATTRALVEGLLLQGRDVVDGGESDRQKIIGIINDNNAVGGVLVDRNQVDDQTVVSLFNADGANVVGENGLAEISQMIESSNFLPATKKGIVKPL